MSAPDDLPEALARLVVLGQSSDINIRPVLLRVVIDLFCGREHHAPEEILRFETIVSHLLNDAELTTRMVVAEKLSKHPATPKTLLDRFVAEHGLIASKVYEHAPLDEAVVTAAALWAAPAIAEVVATRRDLRPTAITALAERPEPAILRHLAANRDVVLDRPTFQHMVRCARADPDLARLLIPKAADPIDMAPLFLLVPTEQRNAIIDAARRLELGKRQWGRLDAASAETLEHMDRLVLSGERDSFESALCVALGADGAGMVPLLRDEGGEVLALALAAIGASPDMAVRAFILGDPRIGRSIIRVRALAEIVETVSAHAARRLIGAMTGGALATRRTAGPRSAASPRRAEAAAPAESQQGRRDPSDAAQPARRQG